MSITNATAAKRITIVSAARTAMAPRSSFNRSLMLLPPWAVVSLPLEPRLRLRVKVHRGAQTRNEGTDRRDHVVDVVDGYADDVALDQAGSAGWWARTRR